MSSLVPTDVLGEENGQLLGDRILGPWESLPAITAGDNAMEASDDLTLQEPEAISSHGQDDEQDEELHQANGLDEESLSVSAKKTKKKTKRHRVIDPGTPPDGAEKKVKKKKIRS